MSTDEDKLHSYPWPDLLKRPRRELLVDDLLFTTGVTTLVAPSGEGKTTLVLSVSLTVATEGVWAGNIIKPRPVVWVAGEGQDDLRPMYEAWNKEHPNCEVPKGCFLEEPIDLSSDSETDKLIKLLEGMPPSLIVTDALADMIGELSEDKSKDINQVYRNMWRVVRKNNGSFFVPHHTGWNSDRERGSTAIRAKSDIVPQIVNFDPVGGFVELKHNKRRGGAKLKKFIYEAKLIEVDGYPEPIPIVTGVKRTEADSVLGEKLSETEAHGRDLVRVMVQHFFEHGATSKQLQERSGKLDSTFYRARNYAAKEKDWLVGGGGRSQRYKLNPSGSWREALGIAITSTSLPLPPLSRGVEVKGSNQVTSMEASWKLVGSESDQNATEEDFEPRTEWTDGSQSIQPDLPDPDPTISKANELLNRRSAGDPAAGKKVVGS